MSFPLTSHIISRPLANASRFISRRHCNLHRSLLLSPVSSRPLASSLNNNHKESFSSACAFRRSPRYDMSPADGPVEVEVGEEVFTYDGQSYKAIKEGLASILIPASLTEQKDKKDQVQQVFYNPIQQFNRDLSVLAIRAHGEEMLAKRQAHPAAKRREDKKKKRRRAEEDTARDEPPAKVQISEGASGEGTAKAVEAQTAVTEEAADANGSAEQLAAAPKDEEPTEQKDEKSEHEVGKPKYTILDALSASGLRALRYSHELPFVTSVTANDLTKSAVEAIELNRKHNKLDDKIVASHDDAIAHMYRRIAEDLSNRDSRGNPSKKNKYDVIDLDPYGSAAPFLDAAVQSVRDDGGLLCVTCTDGSNWAGHAYADRCWSLYGAAPIKGLHSHEAGLRIVLQAIATAASRYGYTIEPMLSLSIDFYCRVFVKLRKSPKAASFLGGKSMIVYQCSGCSAWETEFMVRTRPTPKKKDGFFYKHGLGRGPPTGEKCKHCHSPMHIAGPMYGGPIQNTEFIQRMLDLLPDLDSSVYGTIPRIEGMLTTAKEENLPGPPVHRGVDPADAELAAIDHYPFFVIPTRLAGILGTQSIPDAMLRGALKHLGYRSTRSHCRPGSVKTDAPFDSIWFIMKEWARQKSPVHTAKLRPDSVPYKLLGLGEDATGDAEADKKEGEKDKDAAETAQSEEDKEMIEAPQGEGKDATSEGGEKVAQPSEAELRKTLVFDDALARLGKQKDSRRIVRYQVNPRENWGPLSRATGK